MASRSNLDQIAAELVRAARQEKEVPGREFAHAVELLTRYAVRIGVSETDGEEVASDVLSELFLRPPTSVEEPTAYLLWKTRNRAYDRLRSRRRNDGPFDVADLYLDLYSADEDSALRTISEGATAAEVEDAIRAASAMGDQKLPRVAYAWITLANLHPGTAPKDREIARIVGMTHPTVGKALERLRSHVEAQRRLDRDPPPNETTRASLLLAASEYWLNRTAHSLPLDQSRASQELVRGAVRTLSELRSELAATDDAEVEREILNRLEEFGQGLRLAFIRSAEG